MAKKTDVFDRLDNTIGNYMENKASLYDIKTIAIEVNKYLIQHAHPHDKHFIEGWDDAGCNEKIKETK